MCRVLFIMIFAGVGGFFVVLSFAFLMAKISDTLMRIEKTQSLALAYLVNPDAMLEGTNSDLVVDNALKTALKEKGKTQRAITFLKNLKVLTDL